ncbi:MAG: ATP-binding cassette domain-containing protein, partial [Oscillospiraceae bacterium]
IPPLSPGDIAFATVDKSIFPMSIYENIALGNDQITREQARGTMDSLGFSSWLDSLPQGMDTRVYDNISGGQKQGIANARAIVSGKAVLIFDEPVSALDGEKTKRLTKVLEELTKTHFVLLVTHQALSLHSSLPVNAYTLGNGGGIR